MDRRWDVDIEGNYKNIPLDTNEKLANWFVREINRAESGVDARIIKAAKTCGRLQSEGWTLPDIQEEIGKFAKEYPSMIVKIYHLDEIFYNKQPPDNLMQADVFYYHNSLREVPPPVRIRTDPVTGKTIRESAPFFLEMKKKLSMKQLAEYWYSTCRITPHDHMRKQDEGKFRHLLGIYSIDEILFAIDVSKMVRSEMELPPLRNAFDLEKYMDRAREFLHEKENVHKVAGINKVVRRRD